MDEQTPISPIDTQISVEQSTTIAKSPVVQPTISRSPVLPIVITFFITSIVFVGGYFGYKYFHHSSISLNSQTSPTGVLTNTGTFSQPTQVNKNSQVSISSTSKMLLYGAGDNSLLSTYDTMSKQMMPILPNGVNFVNQQGTSLVISPNKQYVGLITEKPALSSPNYNGYTGLIDLSVYALANGQSHQLVSDLIPSLKSDPTGETYIFTGLQWSPDNKQLVFLSAKSGRPELWIINADGTGLKQITNDAITPLYKTGYAWSPNGKYILYKTHHLSGSLSNTSSSDLKLYDVESSSESVISSTSSTNPVLQEFANERASFNKFQWLDDNHILLVFGPSATGFGGKNIIPQTEVQGIWSLSLDTMEPKRISEKPMDAVSSIYLSPDKHLLVYGTTNGSVWMVNLENQIQTDLKTIIRGAAWSPDSKYLAYTDDSQNYLWVYSVLDGSKNKLFDKTGKDYLFLEDKMLWSPDSKSILYQISEAPYQKVVPTGISEMTGLWTINRDGTGVTKILDKGMPINWY